LAVDALAVLVAELVVLEAFAIFFNAEGFAAGAAFR
jgi:hypothetical protein